MYYKATYTTIHGVTPFASFVHKYTDQRPQMQQFKEYARYLLACHPSADSIIVEWRDDEGNACGRLFFRCDLELAAQRAQIDEEIKHNTNN